MDDKQRSLQELHQIKTMMERSSRFISLSGLSGIAAGVCALGGALAATQVIDCWQTGECSYGRLAKDVTRLQNQLLLIAILTFVGAFISAFIFTWLRSSSKNIPLWGSTTLRLFWNTAIPMIAGALFIIRSSQLHEYELIAPGCLIFYGLALVNASKYTLGGVRYLGYGQLILGAINLWMTGYGLFFWAAGFGILHIIYGMLMWWKYERNEEKHDIE